MISSGGMYVPLNPPSCRITHSKILQENVYDPVLHKIGHARHLIATVEQLSKSSAGHFGRLATLIRNCPSFQKISKKIVRLDIDEAHCIYTAGSPLYGLPAFRPSWSLLPNLIAHFPRLTRVHAFSATLPPHILKSVANVLKPDYTFIHVTSNRPNTMYATHQVHGAIDNLHNYECFVQQPFDLDKQPHNLTTKIADHLNSCLPVQFRGARIVHHYHSGMSEEYLQQVHDSFIDPNGSCRILVATSGESVGVDFPNVKIVCAADLPSTIVDVLQRAGRALRASMET
ncbi:hypothetical protein CVT26_011412, partial [Gymnopilus dilepis]